MYYYFMFILIFIFVFFFLSFSMVIYVFMYRWMCGVVEFIVCLFIVMFWVVGNVGECVGIDFKILFFWVNV